MASVMGQLRSAHVDANSMRFSWKQYCNARLNRRQTILCARIIDMSVLRFTISFPVRLLAAWECLRPPYRPRKQRNPAGCSRPWNGHQRTARSRCGPGLRSVTIPRMCQEARGTACCPGLSPLCRTCVTNIFRTSCFNGEANLDDPYPPAAPVSEDPEYVRRPKHASMSYASRRISIELLKMATLDNSGLSNDALAWLWNPRGVLPSSQTCRRPLAYTGPSPDTILSLRAGNEWHAASLTPSRLGRKRRHCIWRATGCLGVSEKPVGININTSRFSLGVNVCVFTAAYKPASDSVQSDTSIYCLSAIIESTIAITEMEGDDQPERRGNQYKPRPPDTILKPLVQFYYSLGLSDNHIASSAAKHFDTDKYGLSAPSATTVKR
ncbi:hypothetical protein C2E23DRAFT_896320, partial [Lenzites betulinus]